MTPRPDDGLVRGVRAGVLTTPVVTSAALAHTVGGGCALAVGLLVAAGLTWCGAVAFLGRRRGLPGLLLWLVAAQAGVHQLLAWTCGDASTGVHAHAGHAGGVQMLALHGVAMLVTALVLHRADAGLWTAQALLRLVRRLGPRAPLALVVPCREVWSAAAGQRAPRLVLLHRLPRRRGPPTLCCV